MKELEDSKCEVRKTLDLQFSISDRLNASLEEQGGSPLGSPGSNPRTKPLGNFFADGTYAWLSCGPRLVVINVKTGVSISSWTFREKVSCVSAFPAEPGKIPLLLVGLDNRASRVRESYGLICIFDCATSQVLRAIRMPAGVEQACIVSGGAEWEDFDDKKIDNLLGDSNGIVCVALRNLNHLIIDLRRTSWDYPQVTSFVDESRPANLDFTHRGETKSTSHKYSREKHAAFNLMNSRLEQYIGFSREEFETSTMYEESLTSSLICSRKIGCLVSGCLGRIIIWQTDGDLKWISSALDESLSITHLALLEPTDDPRPFCYLWSAHQEETSRAAPILRMYAMLFERKYTDKGANSYFNLEGDPSVKFELELDEKDRITSLCPVMRDSNSEHTESTFRRGGEDSILLVSMETRTILFDLNQWYKEQMPHTISECNNPNAILANYRTRPDLHCTTDETIVGCAYVPETLKEFPSNGPAPAEELFFPNSLALEWIDLSTSQLTFWATRGLQCELLREMSMSGPVALIEPTETFNRCVAAGLVSTNTEFSSNSDKDFQRETLLSLCLEQRWTQYLLKCAREWSDGSASYLFPAFLRWGMQRASSIKLAVDRLSIPLYDQSGTSIGEAEVKQLRYYSQQLECITNVVTNLEIDDIDLTKERRALRRVSTYLQVLLWFYDVGLLPETQEIEDESTLPISFSLRIPFPYERLATIYREKRKEFARESTKNVAKDEEDMFIDELVTRECTVLKYQWEREGDEFSVGGYYPPSSLQSLLRSYLTDCQNHSDVSEMENKHQITIYLLMDLAMLLQNSCPSVNQLIKYPSAFKLSPSLIKLTQAFWLLDHEDYHGFLDMMTGQLVSDSDVKEWHHKLVMRTLIRNNQNKLALIYLRVRKPPLSSLDDQSTMISLSVGHGLVQSAFHRRPPSHYAQLLTSFYRACKKYDRLHDILHLVLDPEEEEVFVKFLEDEKTEDTRLLYYLQRCRYAEASNVFPVGSGLLARSNYQRNNERSVPLTIFNAYNATLPDITRKFSAHLSSKGSNVESASRYPRPMSHCKNRLKTRDMHEVVVKKARETFLRRDRSRIPFVSAPCVYISAQSTNVDTNSVLFVEPLKKFGGKRSLDEMRGEDGQAVDRNDIRKRRKIEDSTEKIQITSEVGSTMVFDTPLVKRKNQAACSRSTPMETPHSILKIRQLIRDSTSPCPTDGSSKDFIEQKLHERERKPRQIRFSLGQQRVSTDNNDHDEITNSDESESNLVKGDYFEAEEEEEEEHEEAYDSPNTSGKSYYDPTLLSPSTDLSMNVSGPRARPSLRKNNESTLSDFSKRILKKGSNDSMRIASEKSFNLHDTSANDSISSSMIKDRIALSETIYTESILSSDTSFECSLSTRWASLPTNKANQFSYPEKSDKNSPEASTLPMCSTAKSQRFQNFDESISKTSLTAQTNVFDELTNDSDKNSEVLTEVDGFGLDRESTNQSPLKKPIWQIENVEVPTLQSGTETASMVHRENSVKEMEQQKETSVSEDRNVVRSNDLPDESLQSRVRENEEIKVNLEVEEVHTEDGGKKELEENEIDEGVAKSTDDYEDEPLALRYEEETGDDNDDGNEEEEENDEVFQSLSNSPEIVSVGSKSSSEKSIVTIDREDEVFKKFSNPLHNNGFYDVRRISSEETNITDDESSRSADGSVLIMGSTNAKTDLDETASVEILDTVMNEASNITNDDSTSSFDSAIFTVPSHKPSQILSTGSSSLYEGENKIISDDTASEDSAIFSAQRLPTSMGSQQALDAMKESENPSSDNEAREKTEESPKLEKTEGKMRISARATSAKDPIGEGAVTPKKSMSPPVVKTEVSTPLRMTRSRRASSVVQEQSPMIESPVTRSITAGRTRRASSLAKDLFSSIVENTTATPSKPESKSTRLRRSISLAKELTPVQTRIIKEIPDQEETTEATPIGRRTRRATSMQKEVSLPVKPKLKRSSSKVSLSEESTDEPKEDRKITRAKKTAAPSKDEETVPKRLTRASSLVKDTGDQSDDLTTAATVTKRSTRKRGSSVPKETVSVTTTKTSLPRSRRGGSITREPVLEEPSEEEEKPKKRRGTSRSKEATDLEGATSWNPASGSIRNRLSSITSIPEEVKNEEDNESDEEIFTSRGKSREDKTKNTRLRRAASMDSSVAGVKRRTRTTSVQSSIIDEPIEEEITEFEDIPQSKNKLATKAPGRRKRAASVTTSRESVDESELEKLPPRRTRKSSLKSNDSETFRFSPPGKARHRRDDHDDEKGDTEVPNYVFSPPHTRSKYIVPPP
ncbi:protein ELYS isoform X2 [Venturia canescens]|nr:protein ELYS isoform X2 [Venturia canescens]